MQSDRSTIRTGDKSSLVRGTGEAKFFKAQAKVDRRHDDEAAILDSLLADEIDDTFDADNVVFIDDIGDYPLYGFSWGDLGTDHDETDFRDDWEDALFDEVDDLEWSTCPTHPNGDCWDEDQDLAPPHLLTLGTGGLTQAVVTSHPLTEQDVIASRAVDRILGASTYPMAV